MTTAEIKKDPIRFYHTKEWAHVREKVIELDNNECQICKQRGRYAKAELVHHQWHLRDYPQHATSIFVADESGEMKRNLISVCKICHENVCHPERLNRVINKELTPERW